MTADNADIQLRNGLNGPNGLNGLNSPNGLKKTLPYFGNDANF